MEISIHKLIVIQTNKDTLLFGKKLYYLHEWKKILIFRLYLKINLPCTHLLCVVIMRIGLLSDTHNYLDQKIFDHFSSCDEIWHAGDIGDIAICDQLVAFKPLVAVHGNIDDQTVRITYPKEHFIERAGFKIWLTHIGGYPPRYTPKIKKKLKELTPNIFVCGHSHILKVISDPKLNGLLYLNPGACGRHGFHQVKTLLRFDLENKKISNMQVIELGKRV